MIVLTIMYHALNHSVAIDVPVFLHRYHDTLDLLILNSLRLQGLLRKYNAHQPDSSEVKDYPEIWPEREFWIRVAGLAGAGIFTEIFEDFLLEDQSCIVFGFTLLMSEVRVVKHDSLKELIDDIYTLLIATKKSQVVEPDSEFFLLM